MAIMAGLGSGDELSFRRASERVLTAAGGAVLGPCVAVAPVVARPESAGAASSSLAEDYCLRISRVHIILTPSQPHARFYFYARKLQSSVRLSVLRLESG